ncbi:hypothetical protein PR202_ga21472 [Eleusine coracana subsp. coracana]|uniref:CP12 domain-containing protein n=1 Tax=Eleusine coracana subsp. coracana TaxID=191504 RepID=A0AAV5D037_ELECO|nr:hypothetical protein PR202_ga21472 [Eleusine coracana subsp. coracana]
MASSSIVSLVYATALPAGAVNGAGQPPSSVRPWCHDRARRQQRLVAAAVKRRYKGTARKEAALAELIERKVAEAMEVCDGHEKEEGCRVAWDEVEEVSQAKAHLRRRLAEAPDDPLEPFCAHNPDAEDCAVVYVDD